MIAAIHQPNFFPWLGYFHKMAVADIFVFLDAVQFPRTGSGTWVNRVRILLNGRPAWLTCPVIRTGGLPPINEVSMFGSQWKKKSLATLQVCYGRCSYFRSVFPTVEAIILNSSENLAEYNMHVNRTIASLLGLTARFICQSDISDKTVQTSKGSARLAAICKAIGADTYLAGDGAKSYEEPEYYKRSRIKLLKSGFVHPEYFQYKAKNFVKGLSILDALFNVGIEATRNLITDSIAHRNQLASAHPQFVGSTIGCPIHK